MKQITIKKSIGRLEFAFGYRSKDNAWGRFGGGWNWKLGVQIGGATVLINLLICSLRISIRKRESND